MFNTAILFVIFNRPETEKRVFEQIRKIKPKYLFVAADGPRRNRADDIDNCRLAREIIDKGVDWECEVKKLYRDENLGCKYAVSGAIDWFFENVEEGIILEDDCFPDLSFFKFCEELLRKYCYSDKIMHISGDNYLGRKVIVENDYYFSCITHVWGWATWRRSWKKYDAEMKEYPKFISKKRFNENWDNLWIIRYWRLILDRVYLKKVDTWDYQWQFALWNSNGLTICPRVNLVQNIGFDISSTHTTKGNKIIAQTAGSLEVKKHPKEIKRNVEADIFVFKQNFDSSIFERIKYFFKRR